ncbi:hypothetical protein SAMN05421858_3849 [Haladaptatus litoreus]|uniref:Uncharacterized protein n=1 Tax=Haladaptatus litoreus TaxID=553468 RepID=A0A1N7DY61_9EURY|nr:hypothetical protein SAMN05421858_3849 [Haladaptatus litoreus]
MLIFISEYLNIYPYLYLTIYLENSLEIYLDNQRKETTYRRPYPHSSITL